MWIKLTVCGLLLLGVASKSIAQMPFYHYFEDTIKPGYRISGSFDSLDTKLGMYQSAMPSSWRPALEAFDLSRTYTSSPVTSLPVRYSSIPHVGLQYSFGSKVSQQGGIAYTQALANDQFIQINYLRQSGNGAMRNALYERNHFELDHLIRKKRYASQIALLFEGTTRGLNGGLLHDSLDTALPLEFQEVEKSDAKLTQRYFHADWKNFFSLTKDSLIKTGFFVSPHYQVENRRYEETGDLLAVYGAVNIDTSRTYDFWQRAEIGGTAGYFFHSPAFSVNGGLKTTYWKFDNLGRHSDTLETGLVGDLVVDLFKALQLKASGSYTLLGAIGEKNLTAKLGYKRSFADLNVKFTFNQSYPKNYQRTYYGNAVNYSWQTKTLITTTKLEAQIRSRRSFLPIVAGVSFYNTLNNPFFLNNHWRQDTLSNLTFLNLYARADLRLGKLFFQPAIRYQQSTFDYVPTLQASARIGFDGYLFKAKKLRASLGVDVGYCSSFSLLDYVPMMDAYILPVNSTLVRNYQAMPKLHVFTQFDLGFFRWFIRIENIEQAFLHNVNQEAIGYPVVPLQIRLGLSWDLFN